MSSLSVLMYHDLYDTREELDEIPAEDRPYAIRTSAFREQLDAILNSGIEFANPEILDQNDYPENQHSVLLTFDDGHRSFFDKAAPVLKEYKLSAIFFVTSDMIEQRPDFCDWQQLRDMSDNGMYIHAHGKTHRFIADLDKKDAIDEIFGSMETIELKIRSSVWSMSFPGGRYSHRDVGIASDAGYQYLFTSDVGINRMMGSSGKKLLNRFVIRSTTKSVEVVAMAKGTGLFVLKLKCIATLKALLKKTFGNILYHMLYKRHVS